MPKKAVFFLLIAFNSAVGVRLRERTGKHLVLQRSVFHRGYPSWIEPLKEMEAL